MITQGMPAAFNSVILVLRISSVGKLVSESSVLMTRFSANASLQALLRAIIAFLVIVLILPPSASVAPFGYVVPLDPQYPEATASQEQDDSEEQDHDASISTGRNAVSQNWPTT